LWVDARKRFHLSHAHIQMARELGLNPKKFGKLANHKQQPWKASLPVFIEDLYFKRFGKDRPDNVRSIEEMVKDKKRKQAERKERKQRKRESSPPDASPGVRQALVDAPGDPVAHGLPEELWPQTLDEINLLLQHMDAAEPLDLTPEEWERMEDERSRQELKF